jgi:hypothetical protein
MPTMIHNWPHDTERVIDAHKAQWAVRLLTRCLATYAVVLGAAILYGGRPRFAGLAYEDALRTVGAPGSWGWSLLGAGLLSWAGTVLGRTRLTALGMFLGSVWCFFFAIAFGQAALDHPTANTTAPLTYTTMGLLFAIDTGVHLSRALHVLPDPQPSIVGSPVSSRHVLIVGFFLPLCVLSGVSILLRATPAPGSIEAFVPRIGVIVWAICLAGGAGLYLLATSMQPTHPVTGVLLEQVAAVSLGVAATFYAIAAMVFGGWAALLPAGIILSLGLACLYRWFELQRWVTVQKRAASSGTH